MGVRTASQMKASVMISLRWAGSPGSAPASLTGYFVISPAQSAGSGQTTPSPFKDGNNYYVARANALEDNVSLYYTQNGSRRTLKYVDAPVPRGVWHTLRVEFSGKRIRVALNGKVYIDMDDDHIAAAGLVGMWTKADSVTLFDDFTYSEAAR